MSDTSVPWNRLRDMLAALPDNVMLVGEDRRIRFINRLEAGYEETDVVGLHVLEFIAPREQELDMLRQLLPVCSSCRKIRAEDGSWRVLEDYLHRSGKGMVTHGMCPQCERNIAAELDGGA